MSDTPETDALTMDGMIRCCGGVLSDQDYTIDSNGEGSVVPADFARKLERERDEARRDLAAAEELHSRRFSTVKAELEEAHRERDEARNSLKQIEEYGTGEINAAISLRQELTKARFEREEAMRMLGEQLYQRVDHWTEEFERLLGELNAAREEVSALKSELDRVRQLNQHADKSSVGDSTYVLTQPPCQRASRVVTETDWHAIGYRDGKVAASCQGGTRGARWHADRLELQGKAPDEYIAGFNEALYECEQEEAK